MGSVLTMIIGIAVVGYAIVVLKGVFNKAGKGQCSGCSGCAKAGECGSDHTDIGHPVVKKTE